MKDSNKKKKIDLKLEFIKIIKKKSANDSLEVDTRIATSVPKQVFEFISELLEQKDKNKYKKTIEDIKESIDDKSLPNFYQSTGNNSKSEDTIFPFFKVATNNTPFYLIGWFIKPGVGFHSFEKIYKSIEKDTNLLKRFHSIEYMLISSLFNTGFWQTDKGKELRKLLEQDFPEFYNTFNDIHIPNKDKITSSFTESPNKFEIKLDEKLGTFTKNDTDSAKHLYKKANETLSKTQELVDKKYNDTKVIKTKTEKSNMKTNNTLNKQKIKTDFLLIKQEGRTNKNKIVTVIPRQVYQYIGYMLIEKCEDDNFIKSLHSTGDLEIKSSKLENLKSNIFNLANKLISVESDKLPIYSIEINKNNPIVVFDNFKHEGEMTESSYRYGMYDYKNTSHPIVSQLKLITPESTKGINEEHSRIDYLLISSLINSKYHKKNEKLDKQLRKFFPEFYDHFDEIQVPKQKKITKSFKVMHKVKRDKKTKNEVFSSKFYFSKDKETEEIINSDKGKNNAEHKFWSRVHSFIKSEEQKEGVSKNNNSMQDKANASNSEIITHLLHKKVLKENIDSNKVYDLVNNNYKDLNKLSKISEELSKLEDYKNQYSKNKAIKFVKTLITKTESNINDLKTNATTIKKVEKEEVIESKSDKALALIKALENLKKESSDHLKKISAMKEDKNSKNDVTQVKKIIQSNEPKPSLIIDNTTPEHTETFVDSDELEESKEKDLLSNSNISKKVIPNKTLTAKEINKIKQEEKEIEKKIDDAYKNLKEIYLKINELLKTIGNNKNLNQNTDLDILKEFSKVKTDFNKAYKQLNEIPHLKQQRVITDNKLSVKDRESAKLVLEYASEIEKTINNNLSTQEKKIYENIDTNKNNLKVNLGKKAYKKLSIDTIKNNITNDSVESNTNNKFNNIENNIDTDSEFDDNDDIDKIKVTPKNKITRDNKLYTKQHLNKSILNKYQKITNSDLPNILKYKFVLINNVLSDKFNPSTFADNIVNKRINYFNKLKTQYDKSKDKEKWLKDECKKAIWQDFHRKEKSGKDIGDELVKHTMDIYDGWNAEIEKLTDKDIKEANKLNGDEVAKKNPEAAKYSISYKGKKAITVLATKKVVKSTLNIVTSKSSSEYDSKKALVIMADRAEEIARKTENNAYQISNVNEINYKQAETLSSFLLDRGIAPIIKFDSTATKEIKNHFNEIEKRKKEMFYLDKPGLPLRKNIHKKTKRNKI